MSRPQSIIPIGNTQVTTTQSVFGGSSALFDGTGDYLVVDNASSEFNFGTGDFTIEMRVRFTSTKDFQILYDGRATSAFSSITPVVYIQNGNQLHYFVNGVDIRTASVTTNTWYHVAVSRSGSSTRMFLNGTQVSTTYTDSNNYICDSTLWLGGHRAVGGSNAFSLAGTMDEVRVSNTARYTAAFTPSTIPFVNDSNTLLLLHMDGTNALTVFEDDNGGRPQRGLEAVNGARIDTSQSRFGGSSGQFTVHSGTADRLHTSGFNIIGSGFTVESWVRPGNFNFNQIISGQDNGNGNDQGYQWGVLTDRRVFFTYWTGSARATAVQFNSTGTVTLNTWAHVAVVWNGTTLIIYINGVASGSSAVSTMYQSAAGIGIGGLFQSNSAPWNGHLDEFRISNTVRYTANFVAPSVPFVNDANTLLLSHMDGTTTSTVFRDDNGVPANRQPNYVVAFGNAQVSQAQSQFGSSALFDGLNDFLRVYNQGQLTFGTGDFTIEMWVRPAATKALYPLLIHNYIDTTFDATGSWFLSDRHDNYNTKFTFWVDNHNGQSAPLLTSTTSVATTTWQHVAVTRSGNTFRMFVNGTLDVTATFTGSLDSGLNNNWGVGDWNSGTVNAYTGNIDEVRVSNVARYTATFTPSTTEFANDANTKLLLHFKGATGSTVFIDDTGSRIEKGIYSVGNAQVSTTQSQFGGSSAVFDGTGDYLVVDNTNEDFTFGTNNFTVEFWIRFNSISGPQIFWDQRTQETQNAPVLYFDSNNGATIRLYVAGGIVITSSVISANTWYHLAYTRSGNEHRLWLNGTQSGSTWTNSVNYVSTRVTIGARNFDAGVGFPGHIDEVRVSNIARYTATFTPSTQPFVNDANTLLLIHADGANASTSFLDDNSGRGGILQEATAALSSSATVSADISKFKGTRIDIGQYIDDNYIDIDYYYEDTVRFAISAELTEVVGQVVEANGAFTSAFSQTATATRVIEFDIDVGALFTPSISVEAIRNSFAVLDSVFTIDATAVANRSITLTLENIANLNAQAARFVGVSSDISTQATVAAEVDVFKTASASLDSNFAVDSTATRFRTSQADLNSESTLTTLADKVQSALADLSSEFTQSATATRIQQGSSSLNSNFTQTVSAARTRDDSAIISSEFSQNADVDRIRGLASTQTSEFSQSVTATRIQPGNVDLTATSMLVNDAVKTTDISATGQAETQLNSTAVKTTDVVGNFGSLFTPSVDIDAQFAGFALLESRATLTAVIGKVQSAESTQQYGAVFNSPDHLLKSLPTNVNLFGSVNAAGVDNNIKSTISFWNKVEIGQKFDVLMSYHPFSSPPPSFGGYTRIIIDSQMVSGISTRQFRFAHANSSIGANASLEWSWDLPQTNEWTHYLFVIDDTRFSGFGSPRIARLYVNGEYQGQRTVTGSNAYSINTRLQAPSFALGYNPYQEQQPLFWGSSPYTTVRNLTTNSQLAQLWVGRLTHIYDVNNASSVLDQFYDGDYIDLPSTGQIANGTIPQVYEDFTTYATLTPVNGAQEDFVSTEAVGGYNVARFTLTANIVGVALFVTDMNSNFNLVSLAARIRTNNIDIIAESTLVIDTDIQTDTASNLVTNSTLAVDVERIRQAQSTQSSEFDLEASVRFETKFEIDLFSEFTILAGVGEQQEFASDITSRFTFDATTIIIDPIRAEADISSEFTQVTAVTRIKLLSADLVTAVTLSADATVIPPVRIDADTFSSFALAVDAQKIVSFSSTITATAQLQALPVAVLGARVSAQSQFTQTTQAAKKTGIAPTTLQVRAFTLTVGDVLNFDPFLTLKIEQETRFTQILAESRLLEVEQETRLNIIQGN